MEENDRQPHALDRDYSESAIEAKPITSDYLPNYHPKLRKSGLIVFAAGFIAIFLGGVMGSNFAPNSSGEWLGSLIHRLGMLMVLVGASVVLLAYQWERLRAIARGSRQIGKRRGLNPLMTLVVWNVVAFLALLLIAFLLRQVSPGPVVLFIFNGLLTILCGLMVTVAVWHRGFMRGYAIGLLTGLVLNAMTFLIGISGRYWWNGPEYIVLGHLAAVILGGLACAAYVYFLDHARSQADSET